MLRMLTSWLAHRQLTNVHINSLFEFVMHLTLGYPANGLHVVRAKTGPRRCNLVLHDVSTALESLERILSQRLQIDIVVARYPAAERTRLELRDSLKRKVWL